MDESFTENWEQWVQDEVYSFSVTRPHLDSIDEYYNDDNIIYYRSRGEGSTKGEGGGGGGDDGMSGNGNLFGWDGIGGDGSEWDLPATPIDEDDPYSSIDWASISTPEFEQKLQSMKPSYSSSSSTRFGSSRINGNNNSSYRRNNGSNSYGAVDEYYYFSNDRRDDNDNDSSNVSDDIEYRWPDETLGPLAPDEVAIYQPTPYQSDNDD